MNCPGDHYNFPPSPPILPLLSLQQSYDSINLQVNILNALGEISGIRSLVEMIDTGCYHKPLVSKFLDVFLDISSYYSYLSDGSESNGHGIF